MAVLSPTPVSTDRFTYVKEERCFVEEESTLRANGIQPSRVYDDACDVGFTLVSSRTGRKIIFAMTNVVRNSENEWVFRPIPQQRLSADERSLAINVFND